MSAHQPKGGTHVTDDRHRHLPHGEEAAEVIGITVCTFWNNRVRWGDKFIKGRTDVLPHRVFYLEEDVLRVASERAK